MKKIFAVLAAGLMMLGVGTSAHAIGVGVKAGLLGLGAEVGYQATDHIVVRAAVNKYKLSADQTISGNDATVDLDLNSTALFLDFSPFSEGSLHLTAGYVFNNSKLTGTSTISDFGGNTSYGTVTATTNIEFGNGPYLGIGWGNVAAPGIGLTFELGVIQSGPPTVNLTAPGVNSTDVAAEEKQMQDDLNQYDLYPVVSAGISIGF